MFDVKCKYFKECGNSESVTCAKDGGQYSMDGQLCGTLRRKDEERNHA